MQLEKCIQVFLFLISKIKIEIYKHCMDLVFTKVFYFLRVKMKHDILIKHLKNIIKESILH
jgi:hypothetical protein